MRPRPKTESNFGCRVDFFCQGGSRGLLRPPGLGIPKPAGKAHNSSQLLRFHSGIVEFWLSAGGIERHLINKYLFFTRLWGEGLVGRQAKGHLSAKKTILDIKNQKECLTTPLGQGT